MGILYDLTASTAKSKVFISYSHDSEVHRAIVKQFADTVALLPDTDCVLDQYVPGEHPIEGWPRWMEQQFENASRVLCICTPRYRRLVMGDVSIDGQQGRGAHWESELFLAELYREKSQSKKLKAILAKGANSDTSIPNWLTRWGHIEMPSSKGDAAYIKLVNFLTDSAASPGPGLPDEQLYQIDLNAEDFEYLTWQREDTRRVVENVKLFGMAAPIKLVDIYYPTMLSTTIARRLYESEWQKANGGKVQPPVSTGAKRRIGISTFVKGAEFVDGHRRVVVLGGPGAGKTTFLKSLALRYSSSETVGTEPEKDLALYLYLPSFIGSEKSILQQVEEQILSIDRKYSNIFERVSKRVPISLLLDSLDEVPVAARGQLIAKIRQLERSMPDCRIVITCRTADYTENLESFVEVEIARLTTDAIRRIVSAWFIETPKQANQLLTLIDNDDGVRSLTETPLLLSLLCIQFRHDLDLPKRKVELYSRCVSALLRDWDSGRGFRR